MVPQLSLMILQVVNNWFCGGTFNLESFLSFEKLSFLNYHELFLRNVWLMKVLFPAGTTVRDPHHHTVPTHCEKIWTCAEAVFGLCWLKLCCSDDHYTKKIEVDPQSWSWKLNLYHLFSWSTLRRGYFFQFFLCSGNHYSTNSINKVRSGTTVVAAQICQPLK